MEDFIISHLLGFLKGLFSDNKEQIVEALVRAIESILTI